MMEHHKNKTSSKIPSILLIGALPPPVHGGNISFQRILESGIDKSFSFDLIDSSGHQKLEKIGKVSINSVLTALKVLITLFFKLLIKRYKIVYFILSPAPPAIYRDMAIILIIKLLTNTKIITHLHGGTAIIDHYNSGNGFYKTLFDYSITKIDKMIVLSKIYSDLFNGFLKDENIEVIYNGVQSPITHLKNRNRKIVSYMGIISKEKGFYDFLQSASIISKKDQSVIFWVAGDWKNLEFKKFCLSFIQKNKLENKITFWGNISGKSKGEFFSNTLVFLMPSFYKYEGQPAVIIEAMAASIPVIATNHQAIPKMVVNNETGFIVDINAPDKLADKTLLLLRDKVLLKVFQDNALNRYQLLFSLESFSQKITKLFMNYIN
jgi:glycosyltransferase involved in cell wall biosynthesis